MESSGVPRGLLVRLRQPSAKPAEALLAHADRCWKAEENNSARLTGQTQMLTAVGVGLIAVVVAGASQLLTRLPQTAMGKLAAPFDHVAGLVVVVLIASVLRGLGMGLRALHPSSEFALQIRRRALLEVDPGDGMDDRSSTWLMLDEVDIEAASGILDATSFSTFERTYMAFLNLFDKNTFRIVEIRVAREEMFRTVRLLFWTLFVLLWCEVLVRLPACPVPVRVFEFLLPIFDRLKQASGI